MDVGQGLFGLLRSRLQTAGNIDIGIFRQFHGYVFLNVINCISVKLTELIIDLCYCPQAAQLCMFIWT